jgi:hypothetical protein
MPTLRRTCAESALPHAGLILDTPFVTRRTRIALLVLVALLGLVSACFAAVVFLTEEPVLAGSVNQNLPAAARSANGVDNLMWTEQRGNLHPYNVFLRKGSRPKVKLNRTGDGFTGGIDPPWVVYQQVDRSNSNIKLYRMDTKKRIDLPDGVNTPAWEWRPRISGKWILFGRQRVSGLEQVILVNRGTGASRVLAHINRDSDELTPGQVNGNWVVWHKCSPGCNVYVYNISSRHTTKIEKPNSALLQYSAGITKGGVAYVGRSDDGCGVNAQIVRYRRAGDPATGTVVATLPSNRDMSAGFARTNGNGSVDFFYTRVNCSTEALDVYRVTDPAP